MDIEQLSKQVIHVDVSYLFSDLKSKEEFYRLKDQLYYFLIERVISHGMKYAKCDHIAFTDKDKEDIYYSVIYGYNQITDFLLSNYQYFTQEKIMDITDFVKYGLNYIDKFVDEVIKRMKDDMYVYFNFVIFSNGVISLSYFTQEPKQRRDWIGRTG